MWLLRLIFGTHVTPAPLPNHAGMYCLVCSGAHPTGLCLPDDDDGEGA